MSEVLPKDFGISTQELRSISDEARRVASVIAARLILRNLKIDIDEVHAARAAGSPSLELFRYNAAEWTELLIRHCFLASDSKVLDIGCGAGRMACGISAYLSESGFYIGFDPLGDQIAFCKKALARSNFRFEHYDLYHRLYQPHGTVDPNSFHFPAEDASIDVAVSASIITHLPLRTIKHQLKDTARVLRLGGRALYSTFALTPDMKPRNGDSVTRLFGTNLRWNVNGDHPSSQWRFAHRGEGFYTHSEEDGSPKSHYMPDSLGDPVALEVETFERLAVNAGLSVVAFLPGAWCRDEYVHSYQDVFVLERTS